MGFNHYDWTRGCYSCQGRVLLSFEVGNHTESNPGLEPLLEREEYFRTVYTNPLPLKIVLVSAKGAEYSIRECSEFHRILIPYYYTTKPQALEHIFSVFHQIFLF